MKRLPLPLIIPLGAALMVGTIGVSFGLLFLFLDEEYSEDATLVGALSLTILIMAGAIVASMKAGNLPDPPPIKRDARAERTNRANDASAAAKQVKGAAGRRKSGDRRRSR